MTYSLLQQVITLSLFSNFAWRSFGTADELEAELTELVDQLLARPEIANLIGSWSRVWGPAIYQDSDLWPVADNSMYVATNCANDYVVAVAGTNPYSLYGMFVEDLWVSKQVNWSNNTATGKVSEGTWKGLEILSTLKPDAGECVTVGDFLTSQNPAKVIVTGHSLGGALAPALATWLKENTSLSCPILTYPSAGATPGDTAFAAHVEQTLGSSSINRIWNSLDVVPHAWTTSQLQQVSNLYTPQIPDTLLVETLVNLAVSASEGKGYTHIEAESVPLAGVYEPVSGKDDLDKFLNEMNYQHVDAYFKLLGMSALLPYISDHIDALRKNAGGREQLVEKLNSLTA